MVESFFEALISTTRLSDELRQNGLLADGEVIAIDVSECSYFPGGLTYTSHFFHLSISYSAGSTGTRPARALLKIGKPELWEWNRHEVALYDIVTNFGVLSFTPDCFASVIDDETSSTALLLEDVGQDFVGIEWPIPADATILERAVRSLAQLHAAWWNSEALSSAEFDEFRSRKQEWLERTLRSDEAEVFLRDMDGKLSSYRASVFRTLIDRYPEVIASRLESTQYQTLVRGDNHLGNLLIPKEHSRRVVFVDWQHWLCDFGAFDLADLIAQSYFPDWRSAHEKHLLDAYADQIAADGIDYPAAELLMDYRLQIPALLVSSIESYTKGKPAFMWWPNMECAFAAIADLNVLELLG